MGEGVGHRPWSGSVNILRIMFARHCTRPQGRTAAIVRRIPGRYYQMNVRKKCDKPLCILTFMKERFEKSGEDLECSLPFQIRPNFGAICLSILIRLAHEMMVISTGAFPVPKGFGTGRIGGIECVDGAYTLCKRELAWMTAPRMLIAPDRTHISY